MSNEETACNAATNVGSHYDARGLNTFAGRNLDERGTSSVASDAHADSDSNRNTGTESDSNRTADTESESFADGNANSQTGT